MFIIDMKDFIILALIVALVVTFFSVKDMSNEASYWMKRCDAAESVIKVVEDYDNTFVLDVLCETEEFINWEEYK